MFEEELKRFRLHGALRATLAAMMALLVNVAFDLDFGYLSVLVPPCLLLLYPNEEADYGLQMALGPTLAVLAVALILYLVGDTAFVAGLLFMALFYGWGFVFVRSDFKFGAVFGFITVGILFFGMMTAPNDAESTAAYWTLQIWHGLFWSWSMVVIVWPFDPRRMALRRLGAILHDQARRLAYLAENGRGIDLRPVPRTAFMEIWVFAEMSAAKGEGAAPLRRDVADMARDLTIRVGLVERGTSWLQIAKLSQAERAVLRRVMLDQAQAIKAVAQAVVEDGPLPEVAPAALDDLAGLSDRQERLMDQAGTENSRFGATYVERTLISRLRQLADDLNRFVTAYDACRPQGAIAPARSQAPVPLSQGPASQESASREPASQVKPPISWEESLFALRMATTALIVVLLMAYSGLPGGTQTLVAALVVVCQTNLGKSHERFLYRIGGVVIGGAYGLLVYLIMSHVPFFPVYVLSMALGLLIFGYLACRFDRFNYMWAQATFMLAITMASTEGPISDLEDGALRLFGAVVGCSFALVISQFVFPVDPQEKLRRDLARSLRSTGAFMAALGRRAAATDDDLTIASAGHGKAPSLEAALAAVTNALIAGRRDQGAIELLIRRGPQANALLGRLEALSEIRLDLQTILNAREQLKDARSRDYLLALTEPLKEDWAVAVEAMAHASETGLHPAGPDRLQKLLDDYKEITHAAQNRDWHITPDNPDWDNLTTIINSIDVILFKMWRMEQAAAV